VLNEGCDSNQRTSPSPHQDDVDLEEEVEREILIKRISKMEEDMER